MTIIAKVVKLNHPADIAKFNRDMKKTVTNTMAGLSRPMAIEAQNYVTTRLRVGGKIGFKGDLANSVKRFTYGSGRVSYIYVDDKAIPNSPDSTVDEAKANEFGVKPHRVLFKDNQKLYEWASKKAGHLLKKRSGYSRKGVWVGGKSSRIKLGHSDNRFWEVTFNTMNYRIPTVFANAFIQNFK